MINTLTRRQRSPRLHKQRPASVTLLFLGPVVAPLPPPLQVSGEEIPKAIQLLPSETLGILLSANYLVVSDLVKWN